MFPKLWLFVSPLVTLNAILVYSAPSQSINIDLSKGISSVTLECPVDDDEFAQWFRIDTGEEIIPDDEVDGKYGFPDLKTLSIMGLTEMDDGFVVECKTFLGDVKKIFKLSVVKGSRKITTTPRVPDDPIKKKPIWVRYPNAISNVEASKSHELFQCRAVGENVKISTYRLAKNGQIVKKFKDQTVSGILLVSPKPRDTGDYMCVAENSAGRIEYRFSINVIQHGKWSNWGEWSKCNVKCGSGIKIRRRKCDNPPPSGGGRFCYSGQPMERRRCRERICQQPKLTKFGFDVNDHELRLHCDAKGFPKPTSEWKVDGIKVPGKIVDGTLTLPRLQASSGYYSCKIHNIRGYFTISLQIDLDGV